MPNRRALPLLLARYVGAAALAVLLAACGETAGGLAPGLTASMDAPGANLDRPTAFGILNQYRATVGAAGLTDDPALDATAQSLAQQYASSGNAPKLPPGATLIRVSAGYGNFAETFSGWRNNPADAAVLGNQAASRAGLAAIYDSQSTYGVYWVLLLG
jgi:uncharacterized protein YkwD